ncbi:MAG TPA: ABC transporter permease [Longimicrobiales bacterium]|nr:ABC transporter permease [Longimicrobiales bacterium]
MNDSFFGALRQDAAYAFRALRRSPGFVVLTALIMGLGIGAVTAAYSVVNPLLVAPLPVDAPERLVWIQNEAGPGNNSLSAVTSRSSNLRDFRERTRSFTGITGYNAFSDQQVYTLTGDGPPEPLRGFGVASDFLDVLGVQPVLGRGFTLAEGRNDDLSTAIVLSHGFWQRRFGGDPGIVGRSLTLNEVPREVVGVLPAEFDFASVFKPGATVDFLIPFPVSDATDRWGNTWFFIGRLQDGVTPEAAQAELDATVAALEEAQPDRWGLGAEVSLLQDHIAAPFRTGLMLLVGAAVTVLLIVGVNVSNMLLARTPGRAKEVAVRKALGASRGRMMRQLLLESTGIAVIGAVLGAVVAFAATRFVAGTTGIQVPMLEQVQVDASALLLAVAVALGTGLVVGLVPALQVSEGGEADVLRAAGRGHSSGLRARRLREGLVVAEMALACVLLVAGGLLLRSFTAVMDVDLGFTPENTVAWQLNPSRDFESLAEISGFYQSVADRVAELPGVTSVGLIDALPLGRNRTWGFRVVGGDPEQDDATGGLYPHMVNPGYLESLQIPLAEGRDIAPWDTGESARVVLINASGARMLFPDGSALGQRILSGGSDVDWEIVGVVEDVRHLSPELDPGVEVYFPMAQRWAYGTMDLVVRSSTPVEVLGPRVAELLATLDAGMPTRDYWTLEGTLREVVSPRRFILQVLTAFAGVALLLAALGIYGVFACSVAERAPEIGIRMALGASGPRVVRGVLGRTVGLAVAGIVLGSAVSLGVSDVLGSLLFGVESTDPLTFGGIWLVLLGVAVAAGAIPAARAARMRGVRALRAE